LNKNVKPDVPSDFFDSFIDNLMSKIEEDSFLESLPKHKKPAVPDVFFEKFSDKLWDDIKPVKNTKIITLKSMIAFTAAAAAIILIFTFNFNKESEQMAEVIIESANTTVSDENFDEYLAYLDESSIVDFIIENDVSIAEDLELDELVYDEIESELDSYYYEL
jgi:hypothetical protein